MGVLGGAGYRVDVRDHGDSTGRLPIEALDYDIVVLDPRALARQPVPASDLGDVEMGRMRIDARKRTVIVDGTAIRLSAREFTLLHHLAAHPGTVFSREALLRAVWGSAWRTEGSVTEYIRRLRMILAPTGFGECIVTRKGFGYCFDPDEARPV
jgi:DNA-binding response OmpR family regulator